MTALDDAERVKEIAEGLSEAQRRWITGAEHHVELPFPNGRWATFPPMTTWIVLIHRGLIDRDGTLSDLGLQVRAHLARASEMK